MGNSFTNPLRRGARTVFHESSRLRVERDSDNNARSWQKGKAGESNIYALQQAVAELQQQIHRLRLRSQADEGALGWDWAGTKEYDPTTQYRVGAVVIVSPTNPAYTTGINTGILASGGAIVGMDGHGTNSDKALPGTWVCVKLPKVAHETQPEDDEAPRNYRVHVPIWSLPDGDPDSENNYWLLVNLYPRRITMCLDVDGVATPTDFYINGQPVPAEFLEEEE